MSGRRESLDHCVALIAFAELACWSLLRDLLRCARYEPWLKKYGKISRPSSFGGRDITIRRIAGLVMHEVMIHSWYLPLTLKAHACDVVHGQAALGHCRQVSQGAWQGCKPAHARAIWFQQFRSHGVDE